MLSEIFGLQISFLIFFSLNIFGLFLIGLLYCPLVFFFSGSLWILQILATEYCAGFGLFFLALGLLAPSNSEPLRFFSIFNAALFFYQFLRSYVVLNDQKLKIGSSPWTSLIIPWRSPRFEKIEIPSKAEGGPQKLALALGEATRDPLVIVIHGGAWSHGDSRQLPVVSKWIYEQGFSVVSINYKKLPNYKGTAILEDVYSTIETLLTMRSNSSPVFLWGRSAGGQLALSCGQKFASQIAGVISFYPISDMTEFYKSSSEFDVLNTRKLLRNLLSGRPEESPDLYRQFSPAFHNGHNPPTLLIHGQRDPLVPVEQSLIMQKAMIQKNQKCQLLILPQATHAFDAHWFGANTQKIKPILRQFLTEYSRPI